jgi:hypothetical protein
MAMRVLQSNIKGGHLSIILGSSISVNNYSDATTSPMCPAATAPGLSACSRFKLAPDTKDGCDAKAFSVPGKYLKKQTSVLFRF